MILLSGSAIVNEAMLTGESIPVMKNCIPYMSNQFYSDTESSKHTLYGGTQII
jgi:magnesium-transporting ATPase (P-type)